jgi:ABC-type glycerol-3-phosphate transport system substrate-binding protein
MEEMSESHRPFMWISDTCLRGGKMAMRHGLLEKAIRFLAAVVAIAMLGACVRSTPTPEPVTISFAYPESDTEYYRQLVDQFNQTYPHITVDLRPKGWDMLGGLGAGDADVFVNSQFSLSWLYEQGNVLNLSPFVEQDENLLLDDFYPGTVGLYSKEGDVWGIPAGVDIMVMYYNVDLLDQHGAPVPRAGWDWTDFLEIALTARDPIADTFGYAPTLDVFDVLAFIYQHGGRIFDDLENPSRTTFDDPLTVEGLEWYANLIHDYDVIPTPEQARESFGGAGSFQTGILRGQVAMWTGMLSERGGRGWPAAWDMQWGLAPLPRDARSTTMTLVQGYFVSAQARYPDACWQWLSFLSSQMPNGLTPARRTLAESVDYEQRVGEAVAEVAQASMEDAILLSPELVEYEQALEVFANAFQAVLDRRSSAEEAMNWAQQQSAFK